MRRILSFWVCLSIGPALAACRSRGGENTHLQDTSGGVSFAPAVSAGDADIGLWRDDRPLVKRLVIDAGEAPLTDEWPAPSGFEYWLYAPSGATGFLSHGQGYSPYGGGKDLEKCKAGQKRYCRVVCGEPSQHEIRGNTAWCAAKTSELARRCMYQAGLTLKAIQDNPPQEWTDYLVSNREPAFYGWIDDGAALGYSGAMSTEPFRWNNYMKWAGSVTPDGTCTTPSLGQFIRLLGEFDASGVFRRTP